MSTRINQLQKIVLVLVVVAAVVPTQAFARQPLRGKLKDSLAGVARSGMLPTAALSTDVLPTGDGAIASQAITVVAGGLGQRVSRRGGHCSGYGAASVVEPMPPAPVYAEPTPVARPVQYTMPAALAAGVQAAPAEDERARGADLILEEVKLFEDATSVAGPAYSVRYRNQGVEITGKFKVAVLASTDGKLHEDMPRVVMEVNPLYPGAMQEIVLRLPKCEFKYLIVMVDATETVQELDETNNTAVLDRSSL